MSTELVAPLLAAIVAALSARLIQRRLPPVVGTWLLTGLAAVSAIAVLGTALFASVTYLASIGWVTDRVGWCRTLAASRHSPPPLIGLGATVALTVGCARAARTLGYYRALTRRTSASPVVVVASAEPLAFAVPGRPGHVHVTTAMLEALDADGRRVLFAHENAHLEKGHHRFVLVGSVAAVFFPPLRPLARQISFSTERWADEVAASRVGDRAVTAHAIAAAAFASSSPAHSLGLADLGVVGRVQALLTNKPSRASLVVVGLTLLVFLNVAGGVVQAHHLIGLVRHICSSGA